MVYRRRNVLCTLYTIKVLYGSVPWNTNQTMKSFQLSLRKPVEFNPNMTVSLRMKNLISKMLLFKEEERINIKDVAMELDEMIESGKMKE